MLGRLTVVLFRLFVCALVVGTTLFSMPGHAAASTIIYVKVNATGSNNGTSWTNAYRSLQKALSVATAGQQIWVAAGTYRPTPLNVNDRTKSFALVSAVAVYGGFAGTEALLSQRNPALNLTVLSGEIGLPGNADNSYHVVWAENVGSSTVLDGFTITGGNASDSTYPNSEGGGMFAFGNNGRLSNLVFLGNAALIGGGLGNESSSPTIQNVVFRNNSAAGMAGGMDSSSSSAPTLQNVKFIKNTADVGGGLATAGDPILTGVTFSSNTAFTNGGGIYNSTGGLGTLTNVTFAGNHADQGGGFYNSNGSAVSLTKALFSNNSATTAGGGMYNLNSSPTLNSVTFLGNTSSGNGGAMYNTNSLPVLKGGTFSSNHAAYGAAIYNTGSSGSITNMVFDGNSGNFGGAIYDLGSSPSLTGLIFSNNGATDSGGALYNASLSHPIIKKVKFAGNTAGYGGAVYNDSSNPELTSVTFNSNTASNDGGALYNASSIPILSGVSFSGNTASGNGGGMYDNGSGPTLRNASFANNQAASGGGVYNINVSNPTFTGAAFSGNKAGYAAGMYNHGSNPTLTNATFSGNAATNDGGALFNDAGSNATLTNTTFGGNTALHGAGMINSFSSPAIYDSILWDSATLEFSNINGQYPTIEDSIVNGGCPDPGNSTCVNVTSSNPKLGPLQNNGGPTPTMALGVGSSALDAGEAISTCALTDQRGVTRPQGGACDIGAYEVRTVAFTSQGALDGQILESARGSNVGGTLNSSSMALRVGDDAADRRYRGILSFDTSPFLDTVTPVLAHLVMLENTPPVGDPFATQGNMVADIANPYFGSSPSLELSDFQVAPTAGPVGTFLPDGNLYWTPLKSTALSLINKAGTTQFRVRFTQGDTNNSSEYLSFYSGNALIYQRPVLLIYYNP